MGMTILRMNQISELEQYTNVKFGAQTYLRKLFALLHQFLQFPCISPSNRVLLKNAIFQNIMK